MKKDITFTKALKRLEEIVLELESRDIDLDLAVDLLAEGVKLHKYCQEKLNAAKGKIGTLFAEEEK